MLFVDIDGHRNEEGGFDRDMMELQKEFGLGFLLQFFKEVHFPLGSVVNSNPQNNDVPESLEILQDQNRRDGNLDALYLENYSNTEYVSEANVYEFLKSMSEFLKKFYETRDISLPNEQDPFQLMHGWSHYMKDLIIELFNSFVYGNLLSVSAMTRALIESYVYVRILMEHDSGSRLKEWSVCSLFSSMKYIEGEEKQKMQSSVEKMCRVMGKDYDDCVKRLGKAGANGWLKEIVGKKQVTFEEACKYLGEPEIYFDFKAASAFVHGQDIVSKCVPFAFYNSIWHKLYIMTSYIFKVICLYPEAGKMKNEIEQLERKVIKLQES